MKWGQGEKWGQGTKWGVGSNPPTIVITSGIVSTDLSYALTGTVTSTTGVDFATFRLNGGPSVLITLIGINFAEAVTLIPGRNLFVITARGTNGLESARVHAVATPVETPFLTSRNGLLSRLPSGARNT